MVEGLLDEVARLSVARAEAALAQRSRSEWRQRATDAAPPRPLALGGFDLIAECKLRAPSVGVLSTAGDPTAVVCEQARAYARAGAAAISVLTEPSRFDGALSHLRAVCRTVQTPVMRKDFLVDPVQLDEAREAGASGALLITRMLSDATLTEMVDVARELGLFALIECFDAEDVQRTAAVLGRTATGEVLVGVNTRDLRTLEVVGSRLGALAPALSSLPEGVRWVAESGMRTPEDVARAAGHGYRLALVGSALMQSDDPRQLAQAMVRAGTNACS